MESLLFPVLEVEGDLQIGDKTRLSATKCFVGNGGAPLNALTIKTELTGTVIPVFDQEPDNQFVDWMYSSFSTDIDSTNNGIDFTEGGSSTPVTARVAAGTYTLTQLCAAIKAAMEAASPGTLTYTVTYDSQDRITISTTAPLTVYPETGPNKDTQLTKHIGFHLENLYMQRNALTAFRTEYVFKKVVATMNDATPGSATASKMVHLYSINGDYLWSTDSDLKEHEPAILRYVEDGRATFLNKHRLAQKEILRFLDRKGYVDVYNNPFTKWSLPRTDELYDWAKFTALRLIYSGLVVQKDDIFDKKALGYKGLEVDARNRAVLRLDVDGDGKVDTFENIGIQSSTVVRR